MPKFEIKRAPTPDDPHRCQSSTKMGQCPNLAYSPSPDVFVGDKCVMHGGHSAAVRHHTEETKQYKISKYASRIHDFATNPNVKSLREEIALIRILIEERMNAIKPGDDFGIIQAAGPVSELISKLERVIRTSQALEEKSGYVLDRTKVIQMCDQVLTVVIENLLALELPEEKSEALLSKVSADLELIFTGKSPQNAGSGGSIPAEISTDDEEESD